MTGPEHYATAEEILTGLTDSDLDIGSEDDRPAIVLVFAEAQVHATLALAAATALSGDAASQAWIDALS